MSRLLVFFFFLFKFDKVKLKRRQQVQGPLSHRAGNVEMTLSWRSCSVPAAPVEHCQNIRECFRFRAADPEIRGLQHRRLKTNLIQK